MAGGACYNRAMLAGFALLILAFPAHASLPAVPEALPLAPIFERAARLEPPAVGPAAEVADPADPAVVAFIARLNFSGTAEERALFEALAARAMKSPTGRRLAARFVAAEGQLALRFEDFPGTGTYERKEGRNAFTAVEAAHVVRDERQETIALNRACLAIDPEYALDECGLHFAHEVFGHALAWLEAGPGLRPVVLYYDDEFLSRLAGWTVTLELNGSIKDPEVYCAVADPAAYQRWVSMSYPSSSSSLTLDEMRDPGAAWRGRLQQDIPEKARKMIVDQLAYFSGFQGPLGLEHLAAFQAAARDPRLRAIAAGTEELRLALQARAEDFLQFGDCSDYYR